jgi:uncharacterized protein (DUF2147 family)
VIILRNFEQQFKQCDESILNCRLRFALFWQRFVRQLGNGRRLDYVAARRTSAIEGTMRISCRTAFALGLLTIGLLGAAGLNTPALAADPLGTWYTADNDSQVRITNCGGALCGAIVWLKEPNDPDTGKPKTDKHNPDAGKQNQPLIGVQIVLGMKPSGTDQWSGDVYNAQDGRTYSGSFTMISANAAELKGCVMGGLICKGQAWTRAK